MGELHFLRLFADHDEQDAAQEESGEHQHFPVGQFAMGDEGQHGDDAGEEKSEQRAAHHFGAAHAQVIALQE